MRRNVLFFAIALMLSAGLGAGWAQSSDATLSEQVRDEIKEHKEAIDKYLAVGNKNEAAYHANKIAFNYWVNGLLDQSLVYFKQSLQYNQEIGNTNAIASIYNFLGQVYNDKEDYTNALKNFQEALTIRRKMKDKQNMASIMSSMATVYNTTKQYQNAVNILEDAIDIAKELQDKKKMANIYGMLANNYEEMGNSQKSFEYLNLYSAIDKVILKEETEKRQKMAQDRLTVVELKANEAEAEVDSAKRRLKSTEEALVQVERINQENMLQIELLQKEKQIKELTIKEQEAKLQFQVLLRNSFIGGFILVGLLAFVLYRGYMEKKRHNEVLANLNKEVLKQQDEISKQNEELEHKNRELMELNNEKNYIIGIVAHDLKSPLFQIKGLVNLFRLSTKNLTQEQQEFINLMIQSIERASSMISRILDVKALESKILDINLTKTNLTEVVSEVVNDYRIIAKEKEIEIETELFDECYCHIDTDYVSQIFENLISNAIKFSPSNRSIFVKIGQVQDKVRVSVRDEGPGISEEDYPRLFEKFQKLDARPTAGESSTGLGLSIVKKYVEAMNGRVFVESTPGEGSTFHVEFPKVGHKQMV